jgi:multiple sugar transport system substrate-binding protein
MLRMRRCSKNLLILMTLLVCLVFPVHGAQKTRIEFWWGEPATLTTGAMRTIVEDFNNYHPTVEVNLSEHGYLGSGAGLDKLKTAIAGGVPPDVVYIDISFLLAQAIREHLYVPLDEVIEPSFLHSIPYLPAAQSYTTYHGRVYGLHFRTDARGLYMNRDLFEEAGLDSTRGPQDIVALDNLAAKLTQLNPDGSYKHLGFAPRGNNFGNGLGWLWVFGGEVFDAATGSLVLSQNPANMQALEWILSYADKYGATAASGTTPFMNGTAAMLVQSTTWFDKFPIQAPDLNFWVSHIPNPPEGRRTTLSTGMGVAVPQGAARPKEAGEFIKYLSRADVQLKWYRMTRELPTRADAIQTLLRGREITDPRERAMVEVMPAGVGYPPLYSTDFHSIFAGNLDRMRRREITPQQVLEDTERMCAQYFEVPVR